VTPHGWSAHAVAGARAGCGGLPCGRLPDGWPRAQVCLFSYGQSGAGKTHTMQGGRAPDAQGIIPRSVFKARPALPCRALLNRNTLSRTRYAATQQARSICSPCRRAPLAGCNHQDHESLACMSAGCVLPASYPRPCTRALASKSTRDPISPGPCRPWSAVQAARWDAALQAPVDRCRGPDPNRACGPQILEAVRALRAEGWEYALEASFRP